MIGTDTIIMELVENDPITRIKEELPEFCSLVATARMMCTNDNDKTEVMEKMSRMLESLLTVPVNDIIPSLAQRKGSEAFLIAAATYTDTYKHHLDEKTTELVRSCEAFKCAYDEMENIKNNVIRKYKTTLLEFEEITKMCQVNNDMLSRDKMDEVIGDIVDGTLRRRPNIVLDENAAGSENINTFGNKGDITPLVPVSTSYDDEKSSVRVNIERPITSRGYNTHAFSRPLPRVQRQTAGIPVIPPSNGFGLFFESNNTPLINATTDAVTGTTLISGVIDKHETIVYSDEDSSSSEDSSTTEDVVSYEEDIEEKDDTSVVVEPVEDGVFVASNFPLLSEDDDDNKENKVPGEATVGETKTPTPARNTRRRRRSRRLYENNNS